MTKKQRICPVCNKAYSEEPALSRKDNKTEICSMCGLTEAFEHFIEAHNIRSEAKEKENA